MPMYFKFVEELSDFTCPTCGKGLSWSEYLGMMVAHCVNCHCRYEAFSSGYRVEWDGQQQERDKK